MGRKRRRNAERLEPSGDGTTISPVLRSVMANHPRHDRTVRLLEARLEDLALVSERAPAGGRSFDRHILGAAAATRHAVALRLLSSEEARAIWAGVAGRHPGAHWCREAAAF
jgi:hypothetical protein